MPLRPSDRRALLYILFVVLAVWGGILIERHILRPPTPLASLDEIIMDSLSAPISNHRGASPRYHGTSAAGAIESSAPPSSAEAVSAIPARQPESFPFDPNTADSMTFARLGLAGWQIRNIYKYRARGGRYHQPDDFKRLYGMTPEVYDRLAPYIRIDKRFRYYDEQDFADTADARPTTPRQEKFEQLVQLDLNSVDSATLMKVPGIAGYRSRQILRYRERLGGFVSTEQLSEIEDFPADELARWFKVETGVQRRMNINKASVSQLARHPYIGWSRARDIESYRRNQGRIDDLSTLRLLPGFDEAAIRRIKPYIEY